FIFILGAVIGSFLNVCIYRLPLQQSIISPSSHCPHCHIPVKFYDNIPILSFLLLRGKCSSCGNPRSVQYMLVEILNAASYALILWRFGLSVESAIYAALFSSLLVASVIDLHHRIIPDVITIPGTIAGLLASAFILPGGIKGSVIGTLVGSGIFFIAAVASRGGMGGGDIKLIAMLGSFLGWINVIITIILSSFIGSLVGILMMIFLGKGRKYPIPFGPFLAVGGIISLFFHDEIVAWYLGMNLWY
ncbi:MAG: prepilin peptidase, partial [Nitrospirae bacterium]|nr:prepilin peptidase [Nitrospirota bacterium]